MQHVTFVYVRLLRELVELIVDLFKVLLGGGGANLHAMQKELPTGLYVTKKHETIEKLLRDTMSHKHHQKVYNITYRRFNLFPGRRRS